MKKLAFLIGTSALGCLAQPALAQITVAQPAPVVDTKSVDRAVERPPVKPAAAPKKTNSLPEDETGFKVDLLKEVRVEGGSFLSQEVTNFWVSNLGKPVSAEKMLEFKRWVYAKLDERGYLGFADIKEDKTPAGSVLSVQITPLTIGKVTVVAKDTQLGEKYSKEVARRFSAKFMQGQVLDVTNLEAQLNAAAYDLPVVLDVELRTDGRAADIAINMVSAPFSPGRLQGGLLQMNNYGLFQYGRVQHLGVVRFDGFTPLSTATLGGMLSEHVAYVRGEYDLPLTGTGTRLQFFGSATKSSAASGSLESRNESSEFGLRLTGLLNVSGIPPSQWGLEGSRHDSRDTTADIETSKYNDYQVRLRLRTDEAVSSTDYFNSELVLTSGVLDLSPNATNMAVDDLTYRRNGAYQKFEVSGALSRPFNFDPSISAAVRWRAQMASKTLIGFNQISIGGINGIRAYSSSDGSGDTGAVLSFDLTKTISPALRFGVLYDIGRVDLSKNPNVIGITGNNSLELQGAGFLMGGQVEKFLWNASAAKSFGMGQNVGTNSSLTTVGEWRFNFELSRPF